MVQIKTAGRRPTLGEVLDYYTREAFLTFLLDTCRVRRVAMVIPHRQHWEPRWEEDEVRATDVEQLRAYVVGQIARELPGVGPGERPDYYPSFHQSVWRRPDGAAAPSGKRGRGPRARLQDCVFEADLGTWRDSFHDVCAILEQMDRYGVRYRLKFSGHRSLHVVIPAELLPSGFRGKGTARLARRLLAWGSSQAHALPQITRMPYSLNEDTGLVCLPIERGTLPAFRPWQANLHLVEVGDAWHERLDEEDQARMAGLLDALGPEAGGQGGPCFLPDRTRIRSLSRSWLGALDEQGAVGRAWQALASGRALGEPALLDALARPEPDARWLAVEAYLLSGTGISRDGFLKLLEEEDEYVRPAVVDVLLRFEEDIWPHLVQVIRDPERHPAVGTKATFLLTQSDALRKKVLDAIVQDAGRARDALVTVACLVGAVVGDWGAAFHVLQPARDAPDLSEAHQVQLEALDRMSRMGGWDKKAEAAKSQALARLGQEVTGLLLIAAGSPNRRFRRGIVAALATMASEGASGRIVELLIRSLGDDFSQVRRGAIHGLVRIGEPAVEPLIEATASDQVPVRRYALYCLGRIGDRRAKPILLQALDDHEEVVRQQAIQGLQGIAGPEDVERLRQVLRDETAGNALLAVEAMAATGYEGRQAMHEMALQERNPAAAYFLARQGDPRGREILAGWLAEEGAGREKAADLLLELGDERCVPVLAERLAATNAWWGAEIAGNLGRIGTPAAVSALIDGLAHKDKIVRRSAVRALGKIGDAAAVEPLIRCLQDEDAKVRGAAAAALAQIGPAARALLQQVVQQEHVQGQHHQSLARGVLRKLGAEG
jgi:HEAT repeat protein